MLKFVCKLLNKYCWKLFFLYRSNLFNNSLSVGLLLCVCVFVCFFFLFYVTKVRVLKISITFSLENRPKPTETKILPKPIDFQSFRSVLVENFTNRNIWFQFTIPIKTDRTEPSTPLVREHKRMIANVLSKHH